MPKLKHWKKCGCCFHVFASHIKDLEYLENNAWLYISETGLGLGALLSGVWFHTDYEYQKYLAKGLLKFKRHLMLKLTEFNSFVPDAPFLYTLKTSENLNIFWRFQGVGKGCIGNKWVKYQLNLTINCSDIIAILDIPNQLSSQKIKGDFSLNTLLKWQRILNQYLDLIAVV